MASPSVWLTAEGLAAHGRTQGARSRGKISLANDPAFWENSVTTTEFVRLPDYQKPALSAGFLMSRLSPSFVSPAKAGGI
jgi:hypothetical protein